MVIMDGQRDGMRVVMTELTGVSKLMMKVVSNDNNVERKEWWCDSSSEHGPW